MIDKKYTDLILTGIKEGDQIGGPFELAKILTQSLISKNKFYEDDLRKRYLDWWKGEAFDTGPTYASVFSKINKGMDPRVAVKTVHKEFGFNTAGCGPAHRATPLAGILNIPTHQLIPTARYEAKITHYDEDAGNGSAIVILLCRYLLEGKSYQDAQKLISENLELKESWTKITKANLKPDGYIFNVIHSALYFIDKNKSLKDTFKFAGKANYCPIIFSVINSCISR